MALNDILGTAVSGLAAAQAGLRAVSNNIANVGVAGYARQRVNLSTAVVGGQVAGVAVGEPSRVADRFLEETVYRRAGDFGRSQVSADYLDRLQALLGVPGAASGLPARLDAISASAVAITGSQSTTQTVAQFTADVQDAVSSMQQLDGDVSALRGDVESEVGYTVDKINGLLVRINELNGTVAQAKGLGRDVGGAADQRMSAIEELSTLVSVNVREQSDGRVMIETGSGAMLLDRRLRQLSYPVVGQGASQPVYPTIDIRFADADGNPGAATGEKLESAAVGGKLGGLLDLRDRALPAFSEQLGSMFNGLAQTLNSVSNACTTVPAPASLAGRQTGMIAADRLGFTGRATFAVTAKDGSLVAKTQVDFDALGPGAKISDMITAINAGLGGAATASFSGGVFSLTASGANNGVVVAQDETTPSSRGGIGVAQYFGLNDLVRSDSSTLVPSGFAASDPHGFAAGETTELVLRDSSGRALTHYTLAPAAGGTFGDLVNDLNASPLANFGSFSLDDRGRVRFDAAQSVAGAMLSIPSDSTTRYGSDRSFSTLMGLSGNAGGLAGAEVRPDMLADPAKLPIAQLQNVAVGQKALGAGDIRGATAFVKALDAPLDLGKDGVTTINRFSTQFLGRTGLGASQAKNALADATARRDDASNRRDNFSGVNIDEELSQMVVLQNSYSAAARIVSTASAMYDSLLAMVH